MLFKTLVVLVVLSAGLSAGVLVGTVLGGFPLLRALPLARYVHAHGFLATRYDPFMPLCLVLTALADAALCVLVPTTVAAVLFGMGAACAAAVSVVSLRYNAPVNRRLAATDPADLPPDFADPRRAWGRWNAVRTAFASIALLVTALAIGQLV